MTRKHGWRPLPVSAQTVEIKERLLALLWIWIRLGPYHFATSEIFLVDPESDPTYYRGIFEGTPSPTKYTYEVQLHLKSTSTSRMYICT